MLKLTSEIQFLKKDTNFASGYTFTFVNEIEIENNFENLTDKCKITIPRNIKLNGKDLVIGEDSEFKVGDKVIIKIGYDGTNKTAFIGYITKISINLPLVFECEDSMWLLKKNTIGKKLNYTNTNFKTILKDIIPSNIKTSNPVDVKLGDLSIAKTETSATVLQYLRKKFFIYSYFIDETLYFFVGAEFRPDNRVDHIFKFEENIIDNDLEYQKEGDVKIRVKATSNYVDSKGKTKHKSVYYPSEFAEGSVKNPQYAGDLSEDDLKKKAEEYYKSFSYEGYTGTFTTFGAPYVKATDGVQLQSDKLPERNNGKYLVRSVTRTFGVNGYRQKIELGNRIQF